ncbi:S1C family serine protease [Dysosmobacter sp.]|uniref:S1C family serine protease n=1 Tax=Dysosmobacter sp. TaxID=2591382 RepID=UPI002A9DE9DA|nr:trypsin-like peptidase domain-containing protein [Dysosmobacter sp.]MDY5509703.1 trypsin-like peptidase domain-containing protein [Dysosmobacter sp.]
MYNDEKNLYHYTYRKDGSESGHEPQAEAQPSVDDQLRTFQDQNGPQRPIQEMKPVKKNRMGLKITALALCCALLGGAVGGGVAWGISRSGSGTSINVSSRPATTVSINKVDGKTEMSDAEVYAATVNSVVSIRTSATSGTNFFGQAVETASAGSGFVLTADGYIVTNYHVVKDADTVTVTMYNGDEYNALYVGGDEDYDIAVIKVEATGLPAVTLGDSSTLNVGDHVLAIGNPLGELTFSMSGGMVSSVNRTINVDGTPFNMIQTDASINPGNSGGPLMNSYGEVVGIVSAKYSSYSDESVEGLGFAIPINDVYAMIEDIMTNGYVTNKPYLGIFGGSMTEQMAAQYRYDISEGVFVYSVEEGSAAEKAGLQMGDVITKVDDTTISTMEDLTAVKKQYSAGDTVTFTVYRQGETITLSLTWDATPADTAANENQDQTVQDNSQYGGYDPYDLFDYFFGGGR